jgi:hypothetical protein
MDITYTDKLIKAVKEYNEELDNISNKILSLKLDIPKDMDMNYLWDLVDELFVVNSRKSRKSIEKKLDEVILQYGYILEKYREELVARPEEFSE